MSNIDHYKSWSGLKKQLEERLCPQLSGRVSYFLTAYHKVHNSYRRASVRLDGRELVSFTWWDNALQEIEQGEEWKRTGIREHEPAELMQKWRESCTLSEYDFLEAATEFLNLSINAALESENYLIKMLAIMDRRVGKRTLEGIEKSGEYKAYPAWLMQFYELRFGMGKTENVKIEEKFTRIKLKRTLLGSILDIGGGGEGLIGRLYGESVTAIDNRQEELDEAPYGFKKMLMDARSLDFADESFDNVTFCYSLMFMNAETQQMAAKEAVRVLKNGGRLLVWDAEIERAQPEAFMAELEIDLDGAETVRTTYGVISDIENQTAESIAALFTLSGEMELVKTERANGQFYLEMVKK